ncbi:N-acetylmuramoyl-L-alanine amidase [Clostridium sp. chh4-2]|uniref:SH3 domain-containing protein n=1 Tax=Clostridium sp. chh4-2 TaxID=2067550 RepID=UPI000CCEB8AA|nr:SH3 domain-containing protein [Clostridium sp. chh4-2]PNV61492.1 N-acetylmuramoyl-L-alanine amidase [Clostridium sp. chh4-2]
MANVDTSNSWDKIQKGVKETERLIGQKQYNLAMVKARQTLEYMVRCLGERACIVDGDLSSTIDELYLGKWITKTTSEHYHKIRILGNKAIHEGSDNAYDANQAYHLLSQEVYTFSNDYRARRRPSGSAGGSRSSKSRKRPAQKGGPSINQQTILKIVILILCIAFIAAVVKFIKPGKGSEKETTTEPTTTEQVVETTPPETESVPTETLAREIYKTTDTLNVRKEPSTSGEKLGALPPGTEVTYKGAYNDEWAIIDYNGTEAYVASQYLTKE